VLVVKWYVRRTGEGGSFETTSSGGFGEFVWNLEGFCLACFHVKGASLEQNVYAWMLKAAVYSTTWVALLFFQHVTGPGDQEAHDICQDPQSTA
jgi:hypothetical protein